MQKILNVVLFVYAAWMAAMVAVLMLCAVWEAVSLIVGSIEGCERDRAPEHSCEKRSGITYERRG